MIVEKILQFILFSIVIQTRGLEVHPSIKDNNILVTATAIRNTTNQIFTALKLKGIKKNANLRQPLLIHNFFSTISLKDHDTLNRVAIASRIDTTHINNETRGCIDVITQLLNEDPGIDIEEYNKDNLQKYVSQFMTKLDYLKDVNGVNDNDFNINEQIVNILRTDDRYNLTEDSDFDDNDSLISDNEFWEPEQSGRRIYQGDRTKIKYFPFMASIQIFNQFQCGGCIIKSDLVITAASCVQLAWNNRFFRENPSFLSVRVGSNFYNGGGDKIEVLEVYFHPEYDPKTLKNNICLLRLLRRIHFKKRSRRVKKIDFDRNAWNLPLTTDGITIVGWGAKGVSNVIRDPWSNQLSFSVLDIYPIRECQDIYSRQYVTQKNFCAGFFSKGGGACNGDVGGPGIVSGILAGIVSFGSPRYGTPDAPTVFTKLGYYTNWIEEIMEQDVKYSWKRSTLRPTPPPFTLERYNTLKPTTFKLGPIVGKWKPVPINQALDLEPLRVLEDDNLFKEFLTTMFESKEAKDYEELFINNATKDRDIKRQKNEEQKISEPEKQSIDSIDPATQLVEETTQPYTFTALDKNLMVENIDRERMFEGEDGDEIEQNILKLIENVDVNSDKQIEKEETDDSESETNELVLENVESKLNDGNLKKVDDSILTLLYLSDSEKKGDMGIENVIEDFDENVNEGLSIAIDSFKDLTFRDNGSGTFYDFLPKDEMYELLAEAVDEVVKNKE